MQTIVDLLEGVGAEYADKAALRHKVDGTWEEVSHRSLRALSDQVAAGLARAGFRPGDHAALLAPSSPRWVYSYLGILKAGGIVIPIDKDLKSGELRHILTDCEARVLFTEEPYLERVHPFLKELPSLDQVVLLNGGTEAEDRYPEEGVDRAHAVLQLRKPASPAHRASHRALLNEGRLCTLEKLLTPAEVAAVPCHPSDTAVILYTSGTTGRSKGAMLSHANIVSNILGAAARFEVDDTIHTLSILPINHVFEQVCGVLLPLSLGGTVSFCESIKKFSDNLAEVRPTFFLGVPALYRKMLDRIMKNIASRSVTRILFALKVTRPFIQAKIRQRCGAGTTFISGGAALDPSICADFERLGLTIYQGYGITETSPVISAECARRKRRGTVGHPLQHVEVRIDAPKGETVGEILVRGPNVMQGYYKDPQGTAEVLAGGWYRTGDLGRIDEEGFLSICGRVKNLIVTPNGKNIYPEEVEIELLKSPFIAEVVVYSHKVAPSEEEIHALIYPDQEALEEYCQRRERGSLSPAEVEALLQKEVSRACSGLASYKRVKKITVREEEFPKTTTRKIKRFEVRA